MIFTIENILLIGSILLFVSIIVARASYRFGVPTLLFFLAIGLLAGSEGLAGIEFDDPAMAKFIGVVSLCFILFSGGLDTNWGSIRPVFWQGFSLSTAGVLLTTVILGLFVWLITDFTIFEGLLLGAIVSSTDAAAVFSVLRSSRMALRSTLRSTLEMESGSNDPMAYVLTITFLTLVTTPAVGAGSMILLFVKQMGIGALAGYIFGVASKHAINRIRLDFVGLYPVLVIALMFITFSATDSIGGNGFLAIYIAAVYLGNQDLIHKRSIIYVFDGLAWLMQIILFLTLGLLVFPSQVLPVMGIGLLISLFLILIARPLSVLISLAPFRMPAGRRLFIGWVGLKGAVPIVFATFPLIAGIDKADMIFNIVFFVSVTSLILQGGLLRYVARLMRVVIPDNLRPVSAIEEFLRGGTKTAMKEIVVPPDSYCVDKKIVDLHIPATVNIAMIKRGNRYIVPGGSTEIKGGDLLIVLADKERSLIPFYECMNLEAPNANLGNTVD